MEPHLVLKQIIDRKQKENSRRSLRWIAAKVGISSGRLSEIINAKRPLSEYYADKICVALNLSDEEALTLRRSLQSASGKTFGLTLSEDVVEKIADWKPFALLSFFQTTTYSKIAKNCKTQDEQLKEISSRMKISEEELTTLLQTMTSLQLVEWRTDSWCPMQTEVTTGYDIPSAAHTQGHLNDLSLAQEKLKALSVYERDFSSMTLTMNLKDIHKAKKKIREFRRSFVRSMETGNKKDVFQINIQLFPVIALEEETP